jgi:hypothetical protein
MGQPNFIELCRPWGGSCGHSPQLPGGGAGQLPTYPFERKGAGEANFLAQRDT